MAPALRFVAVVASVVVAIGFLMFAVDETSSGSRTQQAKLGDAPYVPLTTIDDVYPERPDR